MIRKAHDRPAGKLGKRLENPLALVVQGFLAGSILILTLDPYAQPAPPPSGGGSILSTLRA